MFRMLRLSFAALLPAMIGACSLMSPPADLDLRLTRPSEHAVYVVTMRPMVEAPAINQIHAWEIGIATAAGMPVTDAQIAFDGGMPQHGHGFPTRPRVTAGLGEGRYRLDGMKFSMSGWWEMKLKVQSTQGNDQVVFNTIVAEPAAVQLQAGMR